MATRTQKIKVGVFFTASLIVLIVCAFLIAGYTREQYLPYSVEFEESVLGLQKGGLVVYMGVPVGVVEDIYVTDELTARVDISVSEETVRLREGVRARLGLYSLATGTMCVTLTGGSPDSKILEPGTQIPTDPSLIAAVSSQIEEILFDITLIAGDLRDALYGIEEGELTATIRNINSLLEGSQDVVSGMDEIMDGFREMAEDGMAEFKELTAEVGKLARESSRLVESTRNKLEGIKIDETQSRLSRLFDNLDELSENLNRTAASFGQAADRVGYQADNLEYQMRETLETLNATIISIRRLSDYLYEDPSALIRGRGQPQEGP